MLHQSVEQSSAAHDKSVVLLVVVLVAVVLVSSSLPDEQSFGPAIGILVKIWCIYILQVDLELSALGF